MKMKSNKVVKIMAFLTVIMTLGLGICNNVDKVMAYTGEGFKNAIEIKVYNKKVNGSLSISEYKRYYSFNANNASKVKLTFNSTIKDDLQIQIYNGDMIEIAKTNSIFNVPKKSSSHVWEGNVEAGKYYIVVSPVTMGMEGKFDLQVGLNKLVVHDREPNNTVEQSQRIELNKTYTGLISEYDKIDVYNVEVIKAGPIKLNMNLKYSGNLVVSFYKEDNSNGMELDTRYDSKSTKNPSVSYEKNLEKGRYIVIVDAKNDKNTGTYTLNIKGEVPIYSVSNPSPTKKLSVGKTYTFKPIITPTNYTDKLVYTSNKKSVASVNTKGKITGHKAGKATITLKTADGRFVVTCQVTVK